MRAKHARQIRDGILAARGMYKYIPKVVELQQESFLKSIRYWDYALSLHYARLYEFNDLSRKAFDRTINREKVRYESRNNQG